MKDRLIDSIEELTEALTASYNTDGEDSAIFGRTIPSREGIRTVLTALYDLLFPGYYSENTGDRDSVRSFTGERLLFVYRKLSDQIEKGLRHRAEAGEGCPEPDECSQLAHTFSRSLLEALPDIRASLKNDIDALFEGDPAARTRSEVILAYPGLTAITAYRIANFLFQKDIPLIPRMMMEIIHTETGIDIHPGATIGSHLFIDHGTGIVVGETTQIGNRVKIYHGVTLGAFAVSKESAHSKRHPTIEDNVTIYSGATILGGETCIGENSLIGANVWVTKSVPANSTVK